MLEHTGTSLVSRSMGAGLEPGFTELSLVLGPPEMDLGPRSVGEPGSWAHGSQAGTRTTGIGLVAGKNVVVTYRRYDSRKMSSILIRPSDSVSPLACVWPADAEAHSPQLQMLQSSVQQSRDRAKETAIHRCRWCCGKQEGLVCGVIFLR